MAPIRGLRSAGSDLRLLRSELRRVQPLPRFPQRLAGLPGSPSLAGQSALPAPALDPALTASVLRHSGVFTQDVDRSRVMTAANILETSPLS